MLKMVNIGLWQEVREVKLTKKYCYSKILKTCEGFFLEDNNNVVVAVFSVILL